MLDVKDIDVYYGHAKVLHDVSLSVNQGEMAFVIGRNGAGKTTLLKTICGVRAPGKGSITYDGPDDLRDARGEGGPQGHPHGGPGQAGLRLAHRAGQHRAGGLRLRRESRHGRWTRSQTSTRG